MACCGVHFALTQPEAEQLRALPSDRARLEHLQEALEEQYFANHREYLAESDKAWDAMHRALADGQLTWDGGAYPLNRVVLAGEILYHDPDYIMTLKTPGEVRDIVVALRPIDEAEFRRRYFEIDANTYTSPLTEDDLAYTWAWFQVVRALYDKAARDGRYVLFTAEQ